MYLYAPYDLINIVTLAIINMVLPFLALERTNKESHILKFRNE